MTGDQLVRFRRFMADHTTITLATVTSSGHPQATSLFFAEEENLSLIFVSEPTVRHSRNLEGQPWVSATIAADGQAWDRIQGLQLDGKCRLLHEQEVEAAWTIYSTKYPFVLQNEQLGQRIRKSGFYCLRPTWIRLVDNTRGFGFKEELELFLAG